MSSIIAFSKAKSFWPRESIYINFAEYRQAVGTNIADSDCACRSSRFLPA